MPPHLGGLVRRCPNHPDTLTIGLCNDCGRSYCSRCLHIYEMKTQSKELRLYVCPNCLRVRQNEKAKGLIYYGAWIFLCGLLFTWFISSEISVLGTIFTFSVVLFFSTPFIAYGMYKTSHPEAKPTVYDEMEAMEALMEASVDKATLDAGKLYDKILLDYVIRYGSISGKELLNDSINYYLKRGLDRKEAILRIAKVEGYIE